MQVSVRLVQITYLDQAPDADLALFPSSSLHTRVVAGSEASGLRRCFSPRSSSFTHRSTLFRREDRARDAIWGTHVHTTRGVSSVWPVATPIPFHTRPGTPTFICAYCVSQTSGLSTLALLLVRSLELDSMNPEPAALTGTRQDPTAPVPVQVPVPVHSFKVTTFTPQPRSDSQNVVDTPPPLRTRLAGMERVPRAEGSPGVVR